MHIHLYLYPSRSLLRRQQGAAAIEFAFIFLIFFMIFYVLIVLSFPFLLSATYQQLASELLREAITLRVHPEDDLLAANQAATLILNNSRLPNQWLLPCSGFSGFFRIDLDSGTLSSCVSHPNPGSLFPRLSLAGLDLVNLPDEIRGESSIQLWQATAPLSAEALQP